MSCLTGPLPREAEIGGKRYPMNTGFRTGLRILEAYEDPELTPGERQALMLRLLYRELPEDREGVKRALELGLRFLSGGEAAEGEGAAGPRLYSFTRDGELIFSGILSCHGVDLSQREDLHWWTFCALFRELGEDCAFSRLVCLRRKLLQGTATREERRLAAAIGPAALPPAQAGTPKEQRRAEEFYRLLEREEGREEKEDE